MEKLDKLQELKVIKKWTPIIENNFNFNLSNKFLIKYISFYCEFLLSKGIKSDDFLSLITNLKFKIDNNKRIDILCKCFNPLTGNIEYKLSNEKFIPVNGYSYYEISNNELIELFGIEFIKDFLSLEEFRNLQLNDLLNG